MWHCSSTLLYFIKVLVAAGGQKKLDDMKNLFLMTMSLLFSMAAHAQQDVTRFLGIPVDGSKSEMIHRLKEKGFQYNQSTGALRGEFNGLEVDIYVVTTKNKVSRIMVADVNTVDETNIRIRFNNLCEQFADNPKYTSLADNCMIPEDEDISYEMLVHDKRYEAIFHQLAFDEKGWTAKSDPELLSKYTEEQLEHPTAEIETEIAAVRLRRKLEDFYSCSKRPVWFMISDFYGKYYIIMYYDNEYNRANGEDL